MDTDILEGVVTVISDEEEDAFQESTIIQQTGRPSKESVSSIASSVYDASAAAGDHAFESPKREVTSPRIAELRLEVMVGASLVSGRESGDSPLRGSTRVSPNSPRKMLTPVSGNCDFQGMIPAHHARRLSSRSASSPRLIISGFSPKQSPKDSPVKVSPRDLLLANNAPKVPSKLPPSPPVTETNKIVSTIEQPSPLRPPNMPSVKIKAERRAVSSEERRSEKRAVLSTTELLLRGGPNPSPPHHRQTKSDTPAPTTLPGYPLQPSLETRKAAFEKLHVQVVRRGHVGSSDWTSDRDSLSIMTGSQVDSSTRSPSRMKKSLYTRRVLRIRRHSDPGFSYTSPWPRYIKSSKPSALDMPPPVQFVGENRRFEFSSDAIRPMAVRAPSPATTSSTLEPSQPPSPSQSPASLASSSPPAPVPSSRFISSVSVTELASEDFDIPQYAREVRHDSVVATMSISDAPSPLSPFLTGQLEEISSAASQPHSTLEGEEQQTTLPRKKRSSILSNLSSPLKDGLLGRATSPRLPSLRRKSRAQSVQSPPSPALPLVAAPALPPPSSPPKPKPARLAQFEKATSSSSIFGRSGRSKSPIRNLSHTTGAPATKSAIGISAVPLQNIQSAPSLLHSHDVSENAASSGTALPTPAPQPRGSLLGSRASSMPNQQQHSEEGTSAPMRKSSSFATATASSIASSLFPVIREKSPTSSPTTRSKRRASFNFTAFDATVAALKQKFRRKTSASGIASGQKVNMTFRESVSTPNSPVYDRRTMPSNSMNSLYSETSEDGHFSTAVTNAASSRRRETRLGTSNAPFHLENRRNSDAADSMLDQEDTSDSEMDASFKVGGYGEGSDDDEEEPVPPKRDLDDPALACVLKVGTVEDVLRSIGQVQVRKKRLDLFDALFLSSSDFMDPSGEQMTGKVADYVEDSSDLDALERWLIGFRGMDKLRFYDPSVAARVREVIDTTVAALEEKELARAATLKAQEEDARVRMVSATSPRASIRLSGETLEVEETSSVVRVMEVIAATKVEDAVEENQDSPDLPIEDSSSDGRPYQRRQGRSSRFSSLTSSSGSDDEDEDEDEGEEDEDQQKRRIGLRLLRLLNRNDALDVADVTAGGNDWALDLDEARHGGVSRRKSETDIPAMVVEEEEAAPILPRRAYSLPFLLIWSHPSTVPLGADIRRRELSTGSYGSFSARSSSFHSSSAALESILRLREVEDEEKDTMCMLGLQVRDESPIPQPLKTSSSEALSLSLQTNPASPLSPTMMMMLPTPGRSLSATQNLPLAVHSHHQPQHRRTLSIGEDSTTQYFYYASSQQATSAAAVLMTVGRGTEDSSADDTTTATAISPRSLDAQQLSAQQQQQQQRRMTASSIATAASSSTNVGPRQRGHTKQPSSSSLQAFRSTSGRPHGQHRTHTGRRSAVSSSFSSFVFMEAETFALPEPSARGDITRYDPHLVAEQLTMTMCRTAYFRITPTALRTTETRKRDEAVQRMMRYFEILSTWPVTEILSDPRRRASDRIDDFGFFVALAQACREAGNYHAVFALVGGLQSPLLIWVTEIAHRRDKKLFASLKRLVRTDNNYRVYHADLSKRSLKKPCIPYLGLLNRSLIALQCDAPIFLDSEKRLINFVRCSRIFSAINDYLKWQGKPNVATASSTAIGRGSPFLTRQASGHAMRIGGGGVASGLSGTHAFPSSGIFLDPCIRKALADNMARSVLDYRELSSMSAEAKSWYLKSVRQRAFHRARVLGHQIVQVGNE